MINLHIVAVTQITKLFLKQRSRQEENLILNVSAIAGFVPGPQVSVHFATRAHFLNFSLALADETRGSDAHVTCLCPGPTRIAFFERAGMSDVRLARGKPILLMDAKDVARIGYKALKRHAMMVVPGFRNKILPFMAAVAPRSLAIRVTRWLMERRWIPKTDARRLNQDFLFRPISDSRIYSSCLNRGPKPEECLGAIGL